MYRPTKEEWDTFLVSKDVGARLEQLQAEGVLESVFPSFKRLVGFGGGDSGHKDLWEHTKQVVRQTVPKVDLRWASLFHDIAKPVCFDVRSGKVSFHGHETLGAKIFRQEAARVGFFKPDQVKMISFIIENLGHVEAYEPDWSDGAVRRLDKRLDEFGYLCEVFSVARADCTTANPKKRRRQLQRTADLLDRIYKLRDIDALEPALPKGLGDALQARLGLSPGPELGQVMRALKGRVEAGELPRNADFEVYLSSTMTLDR
jgi:poly(A) polymerase